MIPDGSATGTADRPALPPDPQMRAVIAAVHDHFGGPLCELGVETVRRLRADMSGPGAPVADGIVTVDGETAAGTPLRRYLPANGDEPGIVVHLHGGGWVLGGLDESDAFCRALARATGCEIVSVGYRLAPEHPYPAAVDDADEATRWVASTLAGGRPLVVLGDSAGGNLAAAVARRSRDRGSPGIALQVLVYPVLDHRMHTQSYRDHAAPLLLGAADMAWFWSQYVPDAARRADPDASPGLVPDLRGLPPALVVVAGFDPLRDEVGEHAERLREAGVPTVVHRYDAMAHGFFPMAGSIDVAGEALRAAAEVIRETCRTAVEPH